MSYGNSSVAETLTRRESHSALARARTVIHLSSLRNEENYGSVVRECLRVCSARVEDSAEKSV